MSTKIFQSQLELQQSSTTATPSIGYVILAPKTDNKIYLKNSAGVEKQILTTDDLSSGGAYLPLSGGTVSGYVTFGNDVDFLGSIVQFKTQSNSFYGENYFPDIPDFRSCATQVNLGLNENNQLGIINSGGGSYTLPIASASVLGGIKVGSGLAINASTGVLCATASGGGSGAYLPLSGGSMYTATLVSNLNAEYLQGCRPTCFASATHTHSYDNYKGWNISIDGANSAYIPSMNTSTSYAGGINFKSGQGITITPTSIIGNKLNLKFDADLSSISIPIDNSASQATLTADCTLAVSSWTTIKSISLPEAGTYYITAKVFATLTGNVTAFFRLGVGSTYYDYSVLPSEAPTGTGTGSNTTTLIAVISVASASTLTLTGYTANSGIVAKSSMSLGGVTATGLTKITYLKVA